MQPKAAKRSRGTNTVPESLNIDPHVRLYTQAAIDLRGAALNLRQQAKATCASVALDLGAQDTWNTLGEATMRFQQQRHRRV